MQYLNIWTYLSVPVGVEAMHDCLILPWAITIGSIHLTE